jgi:hypothetical protein
MLVGGRDECAVMPQRSLSLHARAEQQECGTYSDCASLEHAGTVWSCSHDPSRGTRNTYDTDANFCKTLANLHDKNYGGGGDFESAKSRGGCCNATIHLAGFPAVPPWTRRLKKAKASLILKIRVHAVADSQRYREMIRSIRRLVEYRPNVWTAWKLWKPCVLPRHQSTGNMTPRPRCHRRVEAEGFRFRTGDEPES